MLTVLVVLAIDVLLGRKFFDEQGIANIHDERNATTCHATHAAVSEQKNTYANPVLFKKTHNEVIKKTLHEDRHR